MWQDILAGLFDKNIEGHLPHTTPNRQHLSLAVSVSAYNLFEFLTKWQGAGPKVRDGLKVTEAFSDRQRWRSSQ